MWNVGHFIAHEKWKVDAFLVLIQNNAEDNFPFRVILTNGLSLSLV